VQGGSTDPLKGKCPLAGCRLLYLGWVRRVAPESSISYHYCPPCAMAFMVFDERVSGGALSVLKGRLDDREMTYHPPNVSRMTRVPMREVDEHREELMDAVRRFESGRMSTKQVRCSGNHGVGEPIAQWGAMMERTLYVSGCDTCLIAFVQARDKDYGWELALSFVFDTANQQWVLREKHRSGMDPSVIQSCQDLLEHVRSGYDPVTRTFANRTWGVV
jgi:hypothetical protein